jgi:uncharacterized protein (TIGR02444 family)
MSAKPSELPDNPFWDFSAHLYAQPGVSKACLRLQDEFDLDVNLLLFCLWCAHCGPGRLSREDLLACAELIRAWQAETLQPLREIRRHPQSSLPADLAAFSRHSLLAAELAAERVEQELLYRWASGRVRAVNVDGPAEAARNLVAYLAMRKLEASAVATELRSLLAARPPA